MSSVPLELRGRRVLVAGGSPAAARRARDYAREGAEVVLVAEHACEDAVELADAGRLTWVPRAWTATDLDGAWLVHAATGSAGDDDSLADAATERRIWCVREPAARPTRPTNGGGRGWVALVGGGPGDPGLITVRGLDLVRQADVLVVDRLAPWDVLDGIDPDVEVIDVGKTPGNHPVPQSEINRLLVDHATAGRRVVRLKGGDPFVFGRGGEEAAVCRAEGIDVIVVPGVTSALSVPAAAGIPVTHRDTSRSVTVLTGHDSYDAQRLTAFAALTATGGTLVVLMGIARLEELCAGLLGAGTARTTPVAIVERGWTPAQRTTRTTLAEVARVAADRDIRPPAVVVIGDVAALADRAVLDTVRDGTT